MSRPDTTERAFKQSMAGLIPQDFISDLIDRADIVEVIGRRVQLKKAGREFKACCPFHDEKTPSFTVSPTKGFYHCFGCGAHGTPIDFLMEFDHMSFPEAVETLANSMGLEVPRDESDRPARRYDELFDLTSRVERFWQAELRDNDKAVDYLKQRGIDGTTAKRFALGYAAGGWSTVLDRFGASDEAAERLLATGLVIRKDNGRHYDRFRDRIVFPIRDVRGRCIGFGGRAMGDGEPKYLNSPETVLFHKGRELYGLYEARQALRQIDRFCRRRGLHGRGSSRPPRHRLAVATLGTATTADHLNRLFRQSPRTSTSASMATAPAGKLPGGRWRTHCHRFAKADRCVSYSCPTVTTRTRSSTSSDRNAFVGQLDAGMALSDFLIAELSSQVDLESVDGRARLAELAKPLLAKMRRASIESC